jgi:hypothetical protein
VPGILNGCVRSGAVYQEMIMWSRSVAAGPPWIV